LSQEPEAPRAQARLDWADAAVPLVVGVFAVVKAGDPDPVKVVGNGLGHALAVACVFIGIRQVLWALNRRSARPRPRQPLGAAAAGILFWAFVIFRR
jgi:hypothetical protein